MRLFKITLVFFALLLALNVVLYLAIADSSEKLSAASHRLRINILSGEDGAEELETLQRRFLETRKLWEIRLNKDKTDDIASALELAEIFLKSKDSGGMERALMLFENRLDNAVRRLAP